MSQTVNSVAPKVILVLVLLQGVPGPPGPVGAKGKVGLTGMKVSVREHVFFDCNLGFLIRVSPTSSRNF